VYVERDEQGKEVWKGGRSEGLAVASLDMFKAGVFSTSKGYTVDGECDGYKQGAEFKQRGG
jgi:hypothetical protein